MATLAEAPAGRAKRRVADPFDGGVPLALLMIAVTGVGFYRTFFSQLGNVDAAHMAHGAASTGWLVLVLAQAMLIRSRQYKWHRILGWSSLLFFAAMMVTSWQMIALMLSGKTRLPFDFAKLFAYSDLVDLPLLVILYGAAILLRKDRHLHSRLMSATMLAVIIPAAARMFNLVWPGPDGLIFAMHPTYLFVLGILAFAIFADWKNGRLRWPLPFAFAWFVFDYATIFPAWHSQWFNAVAKAIAATG